MDANRFIQMKARWKYIVIIRLLVTFRPFRYGYFTVASYFVVLGISPCWAFRCGKVFRRRYLNIEI